MKIQRSDLVYHLASIGKQWRHDKSTFMGAAADLISASKRDAPYMGKSFGDYVLAYTREPEGGKKTKELIADAWRLSREIYG